MTYRMRCLGRVDLRALWGIIFLSSFGISLLGADQPAPPRLAANNAAALKSSIGTLATVSGRVSRSSVSKSGHHFLNFFGSDLTLVCFKEHVSKFEGRGPAIEFRDKHVLVTGQPELYRGKPQIKLTAAGQIKLQDKSSTAPSPTAAAPVDTASAGKASKLKFQLKQLGEDLWLSPAGLRYSGKDPQGLTRLEHVLRHAADQPRRAGPHGVFDGDRDAALATIDEAWTIAKQKKIQPKTERRTSAYTVPMGRRVGYLGGQLGSRRKHPALKHVFIVVRTGTNDIITAFPKSSK